MKRSIDVIVAAAALTLLAPLLGVIGVVIRLSDGKPILHRGPRVGLYGRTFHILKFRTMRVHSQGMGEITVSQDPRVTPIGRLLRVSKLDELPQLINVLRGDMALVGPRPESPHFVGYYTPQQREVLTLRPGVTGLSQVLFRHEERLMIGRNPEEYYRAVVMPTKLAIDLDYVQRRSFGLDLRILARTLRALVWPPADATAQAEAAIRRTMMTGAQGGHRE